MEGKDGVQRDGVSGSIDGGENGEMDEKMSGQVELLFIAEQFGSSVVSDSLRPHGIQHARLPCHHQLLEPTQTLVHHISKAILSSHPLLFPSPAAFNPCQHQGLFK